MVSCPQLILYKFYYFVLLFQLGGSENRVLEDEETFGPSANFHLIKRSNMLSILTPDLYLEFRGFRTIYIRVAKSIFSGEMSGLCGNADGKTDKDSAEYMLSDTTKWSVYSAKYLYSE